MNELGRFSNVFKNPGFFFGKMRLKPFFNRISSNYAIEILSLIFPGEKPGNLDIFAEIPDLLNLLK
jgi:hypothetical protein